MDAAHIHLVVNHIPILFTPLALIILIWGWMRDVKSYVRLSMWGFIIAGVFAYIAFQSGEGAEEIVEGVIASGEQFIHDHEEWAEWSLWGSLILGVLSIAGLYVDTYLQKLKKTLLVGIIILSSFNSGILAYTAYLGGQIRHSEIRPQQTQVDQPSSETDTDAYEE